MGEPRGCPTPGACSALADLSSARERIATLEAALKFYSTVWKISALVWDRGQVARSALGDQA